MRQILAKPARAPVSVVLAGLWLLAASGCSNQLARVHGKVTLNGKPLERAGVEFRPIGGHGMPANGITISDGSFFMDTHDKDDGAWPGEYKVVISKYQVDPAMMEQKIDPTDPKSTARAYAAAAKVTNKPRKYLIPNVYRHEETTPLRWKVPDDNGKTLELSSSAK